MYMKEMQSVPSPRTKSHGQMDVEATTSRPLRRTPPPSQINQNFTEERKNKKASAHVYDSKSISTSRRTGPEMIEPPMPSTPARALS